MGGVGTLLSRNCRLLFGRVWLCLARYTTADSNTLT